MTNKYKGQSLFKEVENKDLRAWNRTSVFFNLYGAQGKEAAQGYVMQFDVQEREEIMSIFQRVKTDGYNVTRNAIIGGV